MELRHLRYFIAVAEELHFRRAAERLHVAQPAVSEQIRKLEEELGVRLFDRNHRSVELTAAGDAMLHEARHVLRHADVAQQAARSARDRGLRRLRVGFIADVLPASVPRALRTLGTSTDSMHITFETAPALSLLNAVRDTRLDAAVVCLPAPTRGLRTLSLGTERAVAALPAGDRRAVQDNVDFEHMQPERLVVLPRAINPAFYDAIVTSCRENGISPTLVEVGESHVEHALLAVSAGAGMAVLPESLTERYPAAGIRFLPLTPESAVVCETVVVTRADASEHGPTAALLRALDRARRFTIVPNPPAVAVPSIVA